MQIMSQIIPFMASSFKFDNIDRKHHENNTLKKNIKERVKKS